MKSNAIRPLRAVLLAATIAISSSFSNASTQLDEDVVDKRPYIFTQQHNNNASQKVRLGWPLQVQLPGNPAVWTYQDDESKTVSPRGSAMVFSPGRIDGTSSIYIFDFVLAENAKPGDEGIITITSSNPPESLNRVTPDGVYQIKFVILPSN